MRESCQTIGKIYATQYRYRGFFTNLMIYAAASAGVGYVVKKALDKLFGRLSARDESNSKASKHE